MIFGLGLEKAGTNPPVLQRAFELGIRFFDTAPLYSNGMNEYLFGEALKTSGVPRGDVTISTKTHERDPQNALALLDNSLTQLQTDYVDIWSLHDLSTIWDIKVASALDRAKKDGKARYVGVTCNRDPQILKQVLSEYPFDYVMMTLNVADKSHASFINDVLPIVGNTKVIAMQVFMRGRSRYQAVPYFDSLTPKQPHPMCPTCENTQLNLTAYDTKPVTAKWVCPKCSYNIDTLATDVFQIYQDCVDYTASYNPEVMLIGVNSVRQLEMDYIAFKNAKTLSHSKKKELEDKAKPYSQGLNFFKTPLQKIGKEK